LQKTCREPAVVAPILVLADDTLDAEYYQDVLEFCRSFAGFLQQPVDLGIGDAAAVTAAYMAAATAGMPMNRLAPQPFAAAPMTSADFVYREDGRPDWSTMWTGFCELALYGGPSHRGDDDAITAPSAADLEQQGDVDAVAEIRRGIYETTGLFAEPAEPGWLAITCRSRKMAAWLAASIILENVEARFDGERLSGAGEPVL
jgi:hypothetical protein